MSKESLFSRKAVAAHAAEAAEDAAEAAASADAEAEDAADLADAAARAAKTAKSTAAFVSRAVAPFRLAVAEHMTGGFHSSECRAFQM